MIGAVIATQLSIERILHQIMCLLLQLFIGLNTVRVEHPTVKCVTNSISGRMWIKRCIGFLMVLAVHTDPDDRRPHQREISAGANVVLKPFRHDKRLVGQQTVVAQRYAHSVPVMPKYRPGGNHQNSRNDRVAKDAQNQNEFLVLPKLVPKLLFKA